MLTQYLKVQILFFKNVINKTIKDINADIEAAIAAYFAPFPASITA